MKNSHIIAFVLLTLVIVMVAYTQYKQQKFLDNLTTSLAGINQDNDNYRLQTKTLLSNIKQEVDKPEEREPIGFKLPPKKEA